MRTIAASAPSARKRSRARRRIRRGEVEPRGGALSIRRFVTPASTSRRERVVVVKLPSRERRCARPGDVFAVPLGDGRYGLCWVSAATRNPECVIASGATWTGEAVPAKVPKLTALRLDHHLHSGRAAIVAVRVDDAVPGDWTLVASGRDFAPVASRAFSGWEWIRIQIRLQWRWHHDREKLLAEENDEEESADEADRSRRATASHEQPTKRVAPLTLEGLRGRRWLATWTDYPTRAQTRACRALLRDAVNALLAEPNATTRNKVRRLRFLVERLNELDDGFIETTCREDLCDAIATIGAAAGLRHLKDSSTIADRWRDW